MLGLLMLLGCRPHHKKLPASVPPPQVHTQEKTIDVPAAPPRPVKVGPVPLAYIVESGGLVRVFDAESGAPLAQASAGPMEIVSVAESGVRVGKQLLVPGPLPADDLRNFRGFGRWKKFLAQRFDQAGKALKLLVRK